MTLVCAAFCGCAAPAPPLASHPFAVSDVRLDALHDAALAWHIPPRSTSIRGARLVWDAPPGVRDAIAVARFVVRTNPRISPSDAVDLATVAIAQAHAAGIDPDFFCATLLQESAFSPDALSAAGAVGIAQFTIETADAYGVDPFDWESAMHGASRLLAAYVRAYSGGGRDPYALALAAYNAGPGAVAKYHGIPPYAETQQYIIDIHERWARIAFQRRRHALPAS